jgi:hypothetical protein
MYGLGTGPEGFTVIGYKKKGGGHKGPIRGKLIKASLSTEKNLIKDLPIKLIQVNFTVL